MIKVLVVDDSAFTRRMISRILENIPEVQIVGTAMDGQDAIKKTLNLHPDLITLDLEMPLMDGFTFLRWVMQNMPTPVIVVSAQEGAANVFKAMDLGAIDFIVKPTRRASLQLDQIKDDLVRKVLAVPSLALHKIKERIQEAGKEIRHVSATAKPSQRPRLIGIASSTGGPPAIQTILSKLPQQFDVPILIAQHMPPIFTALFAERLNKHTTLRVKEAADKDLIEPGNVYIAPGGKHMTVEHKGKQLIARVNDEHPKIRYVPSANLLFSSVAQETGAASVGAVLTGMGDDGKEGLKQIKDKGGIIIAESDKTAIIFGMPQEAIKTGVVDYVLPLHEIASCLSFLCNFKPGSSQK